MVLDANGRKVLQAVFMGAEGRYEDWVYLQLMEHEWKRPASPTDVFAGIPPERQPSARASIVILFWTYFETRIERLLRAVYREVPPALVEDTLIRYVSIGARLDRLYRVACGSTYFADLRELGYGIIADHLVRVQQCQNAFAHGDPRAIDDGLVAAVVEQLPVEHEAWIAVFNKRATRPRRSL
jgi:hypothetical protein